jgi:tellurite resistance-related uncharacterized protein
VASVKLRYIGPFAEVSVPLGNEEYTLVKRNHQAEFPAEVAGNKSEGLLAQPDNWERVAAKRDGDAGKDGEG